MPEGYWDKEKLIQDPRGGEWIPMNNEEARDVVDITDWDIWEDKENKKQ